MRLFINEKPSQSENFAKAFGLSDKEIKAAKPNGFYEASGGIVITWAYGHMLGLRPVAYYMGYTRDIKEHLYDHWKKPALLPELLTKLPDKLELEASNETYIKKQLAVIKKLLGKANEVVIAGDCDNEGELIQTEILEHCDWLPKKMGKTLRIIFNNDDPLSIKKALAQLVPAEKTAPRAEAAAARRDADWLIGMFLSPAATTSLVPPSIKQTFPVGRVKSAVQKIVHDRDNEINNFKPQTYFVVSLQTTTTSGNTITLTHDPENKITDETWAKAIAASAGKWAGPLSVSTTRKTQHPPALFARSDLEMYAAKYDFSLDDVEAAIQPLYEKHYTSYPRTSGRWLNESMIDEIPALLAHIKTLPDIGKFVPASPIIRKGKDGTFSDAMLEKTKASHYAIVPHANGLPHAMDALPANQYKLYMIITTRYLQQFLPDYEYDSTTIIAKIPHAGQELPFKISGSVPINLGYHQVAQVAPGGLTAPLLDGSGVENQNETGNTKLPPIKNGEKVVKSVASLITKQTKPPARFSEATLIREMINAAKYVTNPVLAKLLETAEGIGTEATRKNIIAELYKQNLLTKVKNTVQVTTNGKTMVRAISAVTPEVMDPGMSALFEENSKRIVSGEITREKHRAMVNKWMLKQLTQLLAAKTLDASSFRK